MANTVLITGTSSGIGESAAHIFHKRGWNVIATMRKPGGSALAQLDNVLVSRLDVTDPESITTSIAGGIERFGTIDVLINNAGFGMMGPLEASSEALMQQIFDVNVFGLIRVTKAILPHMRKNRKGRIVNVSSIVGRSCFPYQTLYHATKHAVEGLTEGSQYELAPFGIDVKLVEPGGVATKFVENISLTGDNGIDDYKPGLETYLAGVQSMMDGLSSSESIAEVVYQATVDESDRLRFLAGADAEQVIGARKQMSDRAFYEMMSKQFGL